MKRALCILFISICGWQVGLAQERKVENRPYTDLRQLHFGVVVGVHLQDVEFVNAGPQPFTRDDGIVVQTHITTDQNRYDPGFTVGVAGELRLNRYFQFRVAPALYFGTRYLTFHNLLETNAAGMPIEHHQEMKTAYISSAFNLIFAAPRFNNHRPYVAAGLNPMINLSGRNSDYIKFKRYDLFAEVGLGCDFYLPFFKLRPELKFMFSLVNCLDTRHAEQLRDRNMIPYARSVSDARSHIVALSFYFE